MLESRGADCIHGAMLRTHPLGPQEEVAAATHRILENPPDVTILNTGIGVRGWFAAADSVLLGEDLLDVLNASHVLSRGPKACGAAVTVGLNVDWNAETATSAEVVAYLRERGVDGQTVALQLDGDPNGFLAAEIELLGARVIEVPVYRWTLPEDRPAAEALITSICEGKVDAVTFTARPAVANFALIAEEMGCFDELVDTLAERTRIFAVGPTTAAAVSAFGLGTAQCPERSRLGPLVMFVTTTLEQESRQLEIAGRSVVVQGRLIAVDDNPPEFLSGREKEVLEALVERPGVVFSKPALLDKIWGEDTTDEHVVEVTIGRLRRRLGGAGEGIETVMRRGYRVAAS